MLWDINIASFLTFTIVLQGSVHKYDIVVTDACETERFAEQGRSAKKEETQSMALVPYEPPTLARFHEPEKVVTVGEHTVKIKQDWQNAGVAAVVWDAAVVLAEYLNKYPQIVKNKSVLELGAGTGLAGIFAAKLGANRTVLTDRQQALDVLRDNVLLNNGSPNGQTCKSASDKSAIDATESTHTQSTQESITSSHYVVTSQNTDTTSQNVDDSVSDISSGAKINQGHCTNIEQHCDKEEQRLDDLNNGIKNSQGIWDACKNCPSVNVESLEWGQKIDTKFLNMDLILGADIIYIEETFPLLLKTLLDLTNELKTKVLLSCRIRYDRDTHFLNMMREHFIVSEIYFDIERDIHIYEAMRKSV